MIIIFAFGVPINQSRYQRLTFQHDKKIKASINFIYMYSYIHCATTINKVFNFQPGLSEMKNRFLE